MNDKINIEMLEFHKMPFILHKNLSSPASDFYTNWHTEIEIIFTCAEPETIYVDNDVYRTMPGDILTINPGRIHTGTSKSWSHHVLIPSDDFLGSLGISPLTYTVQPLIRDKKMQDLFLDIILRSEEENPWQKNFTIVAAEQFFLNLYKDYSVPLLRQTNSMKGNAEFAITVEVINYLRNNFHTNFSIDEIAKKIGIATSHMCHCVKHTTGMSIIDHLNIIRCRAAYHFLLHSDKKIYEVADLCGFSGNSYFAKTFHRVMGVSPSNVKKLPKEQ